VAGEESAELMVLLNDAYRVLSNPEERTLYDASVQTRMPSEVKVEVSNDLGPTWKRSKFAQKDEPVWTGTPRSMSKWDKLSEEDRGDMWEKQMFAYVNPYHCVSCHNCCDAAPKTFCMNMKNGKARAYSQFGDPESEIHWAIMACPVNCIHWVSREDLQALEHVTAEHLFETDQQMPCAMQLHQGTISADNDPFFWADAFKRKLAAEEERIKEKKASTAVQRAQRLERRIRKVFEAMQPELKLLGWPRFALPASRS
jgi:ferredoxin